MRFNILLECMPPMNYVSFTRSHLLKVLPLPNSTSLGTKFLTHEPLETFKIQTRAGYIPSFWECCLQDCIRLGHLNLELLTFGATDFLFQEVVLCSVECLASITWILTLLQNNNPKHSFSNVRWLRTTRCFAKDHT
jgi:hypothetical protein